MFCNNSAFIPIRAWRLYIPETKLKKRSSKEVQRTRQTGNLILTKTELNQIINNQRRNTMKKLIVLLTIALFVTAGSVFAQSDSHVVTMSVPGVNVLGLSNSGPVVVALTDNGTNLASADVAAGNMTYRHNKGSASVRIDAAATTSETSLFNLTLNVKIDGGSNVPLVTNGTVGSATVVAAGITKGTHSNALEYNASSDYTTEEADYDVTVTYTLTGY
jgi:hypothetical protein